MTEEKKIILEKKKKTIDLFNIFRLFFLLIALLILLFQFFGMKIWEAEVWFQVFTSKAYPFLTIDILCMLGCTLL